MDAQGGMPFALGVAQSAVPAEKPDLNIEIAAPVTEHSDSASGLWMPVDLPSMGLAGYPAQIQVRKFGIEDLARFSAANKASSYSMVVTAMGHTIQGVDVKMLTHGDFDFLMYWHAVNSIKKTPLVVTWRSRYGKDNKLTVNGTTRKITFIENMDRVRELQAKGYDFSRVGDELWRIHLSDLGKWSDEIDFKYQLATWKQVEDPLNTASKVEAVTAMKDIDFYEGITEWRQAAYHGVAESARLTCEHFKPETAAEDITRTLALIDASASAGEFDEATQELTLSLLAELAEIRRLEKEDKLAEATPVEEEVSLPLDVTNFFPVVL